MITKSLLRRKTRTLLTIFGIAIGVAAIVALGALAEGLVGGYGAISSGSGADLLVVQEDALDIMLSGVDEDVGSTLASLSGVAETTEMVYAIAATDGAAYFIIYGYDPEGFAVGHFKIVEGEPLSRSSRQLAGKPLLLGRVAADSLDLQVGDNFRLYETTYRIVGIYETGEPFEDGAAVILLEDAQAISGKPRKVNAFLIKVRDGVDVEQLQLRIEKRFSELEATTSSGFAEEQDMLQYVHVFTWGVSLIAVLIGGVGVINTMLMSVFERTREFGVLRAMGWRPNQVLRMVLTESVVLSMAGGALGTLLGVTAVRAVEHIPTVSNIVPSKFSAGLLVQGAGVALTLGLIGGLLPAWRASRLLPIEAMRAEGGSTTQARCHIRSAVLRNALRQPVRALLTMLGVGIAMMAIVLLGAMSGGFVEMVAGLAGGMGAHLVGSEADASIDLSKIDEGVVRRAATLPGVRAAEGFLTGYTSVQDLPFLVIFGYHPRGLAIREYRIVEGQPLSANRQILLGRVAADNLKKESGQTLRLFSSSFRIVGIFETGVPLQDGGAVVSLRDAQNLFGQPRKVSFLGIWLEDPEQATDVAREIESIFPEVGLSQASAFADDIVDIQMIRASSWGIAFMALIVGGVGMTNTMVMSIFERTREIGVLRALGWRKQRVLKMIISEALALSFLGGVAGVACGVVLGLLLNLIPAMQGFIKMEYDPALFIQALLMTLTLGVVGGMYPAWRASRMQPVEALRYE